MNDKIVLYYIIYIEYMRRKRALINVCRGVRVRYICVYLLSCGVSMEHGYIVWRLRKLLFQPVTVKTYAFVTSAHKLMSNTYNAMADNILYVEYSFTALLRVSLE